MCFGLDDNATEQSCFDFFCKEMSNLLHWVPGNIDSVCAAVSGGSDSMFLLWVLHHWCCSRNIRLYCVTVDHKLRPESSEEAEFVHDFCENLRVEHTILTWLRRDEESKEISHGKLENAAREARYRLISGFCKQKNVKVVCVAHNWDDQLETYEIRKNFIGTESEEFSKIGLAGMSQIRSLTENIVLFRPVLRFTKQCMRNILLLHNVNWKNDPMNEDESFKRVMYRKKLALECNEKKQVIQKNILAIGKKRHETDMVAISTLREDVSISNFGYASIFFEKFQKISSDVQKEILRRLIWNIGGKKYPPAISNQFLHFITEKRTESLGNCLVKYKKGYLMIFREYRNIKPIQWNYIPEDLIWDNRFHIDVHIVNDLLRNNVDTNKKLKINFLLTKDDVSLVRDLSHEVVETLPCIVTERGRFTLCSGIKFIKKVDLFDVFV